MANSRLAALFTYTFGSVTLPVVLLAALNQYAGQMITSWIENNIAVTILCCLTYGLAQVFIIFPIMGSWAMAIKPKSKVSLPVEDLRKRLLLLNDDKLPFAVVQDYRDPNRITASWKIADEKWIELFAVRGLTVQYELKIKLVGKKRLVKAQDNFRKFEYVDRAGVKGIKLRSGFSLFKGISLFHYERGLHYGVIFKDGKIKIDYGYKYAFRLAEVKNSIVEIVTSSGWEFRSVVFL
jgi:hypothetical protein